MIKIVRRIKIHARLCAYITLCAKVYVRSSSKRATYSLCNHKGDLRHDRVFLLNSGSILTFFSATYSATIERLSCIYSIICLLEVIIFVHIIKYIQLIELQTFFYDSVWHGKTFRSISINTAHIFSHSIHFCIF